MFKKAIKILESKVGIEANDRKLLPQFPLKIEVKSLLTDFNDVKEIPYDSNLDGYISIKEEQTQEALFEFIGEKVNFRGPLSKLTEEASDLRFALWGNQGFLFRYILFLLETKHKIYNMHGCALYQEMKNRLYLIIGGAGSGKTIYLLSGIEKGLKIFSTEIVHFRIKEGAIQWFMGSLIDNVRVGTLRHNFPRFMPEAKIADTGDEWQEKIALDLSDYKTDEEILTSPEIVIIFPRIEERREGFLSSPIQEKKKAAKFLFDNVSQKLSETVILYDKIPVAGLDNTRMALSRLNIMDELVRDETVKEVFMVLSNPNECWGNLLG
jgi:hypothetical protein